MKKTHLILYFQASEGIYHWVRLYTLRTKVCVPPPITPRRNVTPRSSLHPVSPTGTRHPGLLHPRNNRTGRDLGFRRSSRFNSIGPTVNLTITISSSTFSTVVMLHATTKGQETHISMGHFIGLVKKLITTLRTVSLPPLTQNILLRCLDKQELYPDSTWCRWTVSRWHPCLHPPPWCFRDTSQP